jgi:hypothetical protein
MRLFGIKRRAALLLTERLKPKLVRGSWRIGCSRLAVRLEDQMLHANRELDRRDRLPSPNHGGHFPAPAPGTGPALRTQSPRPIRNPMES